MTQKEIEIEKETMFADVILGVIESGVKTVTLMYDGEKNVVKKALIEYKRKLENQKEAYYV